MFDRSRFNRVFGVASPSNLLVACRLYCACSVYAQKNSEIGPKLEAVIYDHFLLLMDVSGATITSYESLL